MLPAACVQAVDVWDIGFRRDKTQMVLFVELAVPRRPAAVAAGLTSCRSEATSTSLSLSLSLGI